MIWKDIPAFGGRYEVSENGEVRNAKTKVVRKPRCNKFGYLQMNFPRNDGTGKSDTKSIHRIVAETFIPNQNNLPEVNHKDGNKQNNAVDNLEWVTVSDNQKHAYKLGLSHVRCGADHVCAKLTTQDVKDIRNRYKKRKVSFQKLADEYGVSSSTIHRVVKGKRYADNKAVI